MTHAEVVSAYACANDHDARILDALFGRCALGPAFTSVSASTNLSDQTVTLNLTAAQITAGFTTDHIVGTNFIAVVSTKEIWLTDTSSKAAATITYRLSGVEDQNNGHKLTAILMKS